MNVEHRKGRKALALKAFTLLEMIVVIAIISVLMMIAVPSITSYLRDSYVQDANGQAQQVYMAVQDYLTYLETNGLKAEEYFGKDTSGNANGLGYIGVEYSVADSRTDGTKDPAVAGDIMLLGQNADSTKALEAVNAIFDRLSSDREGAWIVVIYPQTYTVKYVTFSNYTNLSTANPTGFTYNWLAVQAVGDPQQIPNGKNLYKSMGYSGTPYVAAYNVKPQGSSMSVAEVFYHSESQDYDITHYPKMKYVGQYPLPVT